MNYPSLKGEVSITKKTKMSTQISPRLRRSKKIAINYFSFNQQRELNLGMAIPLSASKAEVSLP